MSGRYRTLLNHESLPLEFVAIQLDNGTWLLGNDPDTLEVVADDPEQHYMAVSSAALYAYRDTKTGKRPG